VSSLAAAPPIEDGDAFVRTREALHAVAEHVLATALFQATKKIGLRATGNGFGTPRFGADAQARVEAVTLVHAIGADETRHPLTTIAAAAAVLGIEPGAPPVYEPATPLAVDAALDLDPAAARVIGWLYDLGAGVLADLAADPESTPAGADAPSTVQLWPEHFDLATDLGGPRANYGVSPGDAGHPEPYLYVGPWDAKAADPFWNEPFGASLPYADLLAAADPEQAALAFFRRGRTLLTS